MSSDPRLQVPALIQTKTEFSPRLFEDPGRFRVVSTNIIYRMPRDTPFEAREFTWQCDDVAPLFPRVMKYIECWTKFPCTIDQIRIGECEAALDGDRSFLSMFGISDRDYGRCSLIQRRPSSTATIALIPRYGRFVYLH